MDFTKLWRPSFVMLFQAGTPWCFWPSALDSGFWITVFGNKPPVWIFTHVPSPVPSSHMEPVAPKALFHTTLVTTEFILPKIYILVDLAFKENRNKCTSS